MPFVLSRRSVDAIMGTDLRVPGLHEQQRQQSTEWKRIQTWKKQGRIVRIVSFVFLDQSSPRR